MTHLLPGFYRALTVLAAVSMVGAFAAVLLGIVGRQVGFNIPGLDAYAGYAIAAALFLALPETFRHGDHIRVTLILQKVPAPLRTLLEYACLIAGIGLSAFLAYASARLVWASYGFNDISQSADATPLWIPQLSMAIGCFGFAVSMVHALVSRVLSREFFVPSRIDAAPSE
jgi:TRAP-type C4-dicarboxylate transport system permease small subunit